MVITVFVAYIVNNDFEKEILKESTDLNYIKKWIKNNSNDFEKSIKQPICLDWYYMNK